MFFTRTIGKAFRGKASPLQIRLAALLAGMLGFVPGFFLAEDLGGGFLQAPGLILGLLFLVLVLNANLAVFGIVLILAKVLSVLLLPVSFAVGRLLLDGPTQGLFQAMINAPVLAWFGLEHYATSGGLLVGAAFGILSGWLFVRSVRRLRSEMADLEEGSERFQNLSARRSVRLLSWVFLGKGKGKKTSWRELAESDRQGLPVRLVGIAAVLVLGLCLWAGHTFLAGPALSSATRTALEHYNGATVDLDETVLDLSESQLRIAGLGMADPNALTKNLFQARSLEFKLGTGDLLSKRFVIDRVESREAATGAERSTPGVRTAEAEPAVTPPPPPGEGDASKTLEDYLQEAEKWKQRLEQVSHWLERLSGSDEAVQEETPEQHDERIEQSARDYGMVMVRAAHLVNESPMVLVRELLFEGVEAIDLEGEILDLRGRNLSSNPRLVTEPLEFSVQARSGRFGFTLRFDAAAGGIAQTSFHYRGLPVDAITGEFRRAPLRGGALDLSRPDGPWVDLPLQVHLHDSTLALEGLGETPVDDLQVPLGLRGPLAAPRVSLDDKTLTDALLKAGKAELAGQLQNRAQDLLGDKLPVDTKGLEEAQRKLQEEAKKKAAEGLKGLFKKKGGE